MDTVEQILFSLAAVQAYAQRAGDPKLLKEAERALRTARLEFALKGYSEDLSESSDSRLMQSPVGAA